MTCCMPGCTVSKATCSNLITFHCIPNGRKDTEWRAALIHAVNRADSSFNPANARICSRHFTSEDFYEGTGIFKINFRWKSYSNLFITKVPACVNAHIWFPSEQVNRTHFNTLPISTKLSQTSSSIEYLLNKVLFWI